MTDTPTGELAAKVAELRGALLHYTKRLAEHDDPFASREAVSCEAARALGAICYADVPALLDALEAIQRENADLREKLGHAEMNLTDLKELHGEVLRENADLRAVAYCPECIKSPPRSPINDEVIRDDTGVHQAPRGRWEGGDQ